MKCSGRIFLAVSAVVFCCSLASCRPGRTSMKILRPAKLEVAGVKAVKIDDLAAHGPDGAKAAPHVMRALAERLAEGGKYEIVEGEAPRPDAVIVGAVWCAISNRTGEEVALATERITDGASVAPRTIETRDYVERKPYTMSASLITVELTMIRHGGAMSFEAGTVTSRTSTRSTCVKIGGAARAPYNADFDFSDPGRAAGAFANIAGAVVADFVALVSPHYERVRAEIAPGAGDAELLIKRGEYARARAILEKRLQAAPNDIEKADILYNIGLCFEGEGTLEAILKAEEHYEKAFALDAEYPMYADGLGRIERLEREIAILAERAEREKRAAND